MLGAICGDIIGSIYEFNNIVGNKDFVLFSKDSAPTDDTVCTIACMDWLLHLDQNPATILREWCSGYPAAGYGPMFNNWIYEADAPGYNSYGNGAIMRISPVALWFEDTTPMYKSTLSFTNTSHNHQDSQATACLLNGLIRMAIKGARKDILFKSAARYYDDLDQTVIDLYNRTPPFFDVTAKGTLLHALICFFESESFEDAIRNGISIGGDSDTVAAVVGALAEAFYGFPDSLLEPVFMRLPMEMRHIIFEYYSKRSVKPKFLDISLLDLPHIHGWVNPVISGGEQENSIILPDESDLNE